MKQNNIFTSIKLEDYSDRKNALLKARQAVDTGADGIVVTEKYTDSFVHEENINIIKILCENMPVPVYAKISGQDKEDIKKYLYAGCKGIIIREENASLLSDAVKRFGNQDSKNAADSEKYISNKLSFSDFKTVNGLIPCIVQDIQDNSVLMMAYMNEEAYNATVNTGRMTYFSRSRNKLWLKGEESGHFQYLKSLSADCDNDTLLAKVVQIGPACHTGRKSCFYKDIVDSEENIKEPYAIHDIFVELYEIILDRKSNPKEGSYTNYLFEKGIDKILKKVGEEATEIVIAAKNSNSNEIIYEVSDFIYHIAVLLAYRGITWEDIAKELKNR